MRPKPDNASAGGGQRGLSPRFPFLWKNGSSMTCGAILLGLFFAAASFSQTPNIGKLKQAAEGGDAAAQNNLGAAYHLGRGVPQDYAEAMRWFRKAADQGYAAAQNNIGMMYDQAQGVPRDYPEAMRWYRKAADQGYAAGQYDLGVMYFSGQGVPQDYAEGMRWFRKAADQGYAAAQNNLGWGYEHAQGVSQDYAEAMRWYRKAADQGISIAQENLERMTRLGMALADQAHAQSCPVVIQNLESSSSAKAGLYAFLTTAGSSSTYLILKYQNNSQKPVSGVRFVVVYLNSVREAVYTDDLTTPTEKLKPGKFTSLINADGQITGGQKVETLGWVAKVLFADGSTWVDDGRKSCSSK
jgi:TPR repeat protein